MTEEDLVQMVFALVKQNNSVIDHIINDYKKEISRMKRLIEQYEIEIGNLENYKLIISQYKKAMEER